MNKNDLQFKLVGDGDAELLLSLIFEMAEYEHERHEVRNDPQKIRETICNQSCATAYIVYYKECPAAYVIFFRTYSSYIGKRNLYIEDVYVRPDMRKMGLGQKIFSFVAQIAINEGCSRLDWTCLDWNENAHHFYESIGAALLKERLYFRAENDALKLIAELE